MYGKHMSRHAQLVSVYPIIQYCTEGAPPHLDPVMLQKLHTAPEQSNATHSFQQASKRIYCLCHVPCSHAYPQDQVAGGVTSCFSLLIGPWSLNSQIAAWEVSTAKCAEQGIKNSKSGLHIVSVVMHIAKLARPPTRTSREVHISRVL